MEQVHIDSITKSFSGKTIISGGYMHLKTGDVTGLFGRNGTGKSTLLSILFGVIPADTIFLKYNEKVILNRYHFKKIFSFCPQFVFLPEMKVYNLIKLFLGKVDPLFIDDDLIKDILNKKVSDLSFGSQKYLQTKLVLYSSQPFCLLDEPFSGLSPLLTEKISSIIQTQSSEKGILITDHNYSSVLEISTQNYILKDSSIFRLKYKEELLSYGYIKDSV